jgi:hypothetical protein
MGEKITPQIGHVVRVISSYTWHTRDGELSIPVDIVGTVSADQRIPIGGVVLLENATVTNRITGEQNLSDLQIVRTGDIQGEVIDGDSSNPPALLLPSAIT